MNQWRIEWKALLVLLLAIQLSGCAAQRAYQRAQDAAKRGQWDQAVANYMIALREKPDHPAYRAGFERARLAASQAHFQKAKDLFLARKFEQAIIEYQVALNYDPTNQYISNELERARTEYEKELNKEELTAIQIAKEQAKRNMQLFKVLGPEAEKRIESLRFHDDSLKHILDSLGALAGINIVYDSDFRDQEFSISLDNITFRDALEQILVANRLYYKPLDESTILIVPDNPQKRRQYDEQVIQTFYLSNAELNDVLNLVRSVMQIQRIATNPQLNAITLRDTPDKIAIAQKIIEANDKSRSEILLDVEILEIDRDSALNYGVDLTDYAVRQDLIVNSSDGTAAVGQFFGNQLRAIDAASWSFTVPSIIYNALSTDQRTKILAKPQIRASEGQQVTVRLGDRVPIPVTVIQTGVAPTPGSPVTTFPTTTFQQQDVGINIDVTPRVHHNREITLILRFELTSITSPGVGTTPPTIGNRTVNTVLRLKDGETNLLAGLLRRDERRSLRGVPGITKIPFIRELFASNERGLQEKDIVFTITPHILRTPNITEEDLTPIWIGTEDDIRLKTAPPISVFERPDLKQEVPGVPRPKEPLPTRPPEQPPVEPQQQLPPTGGGQPETDLQEQREATQPEAPPIEEEDLPEPEPEMAPEQQVLPPGAETPAVVPPVEPEAPAEEPVQGATISISSPNVNPTVNTDLIVHVQLINAADAAAASLFLNFDASLMEVKDVLQGAFMTPGAFSRSFDNGRGTIAINASHQPRGINSGVLATIVFRTLSPGQSTLNLSSAVLRNPEGNPISVTYLPYTFNIQ